MPYELNTFRQILQGNWSPLYFPLDLAEQTAWYDHLSEVPTFATKQGHVQFEQSDTIPPRIHSLRVRLLDQHSLPTFVEQDHTVHPYEGADGEALLSLVLEHLSLTRAAVIEWYHWQDERAQVHLELYVQYSLDTLSPEERRYHFYQCLLAEQVASAQERMVAYVHGTASPKKVRKYVQDHQKDLLTYASQVLHYLDEEQSHLYTRSDEYTLPDVYKLIFLSLEELIDYLEQQFVRYLDPAAPVPHHHQVVYASRLVPQWQTLEAKLRTLPISEALVALLQEAFVAVQQLPARQATPEPLRYYGQLLQSLEAFAAQDKPTEEALVAALFRINFNYLGFVTWFADQIQDRLASCVTAEERLPTLFYYRKFCKQLPVDTSLSYQPAQPSVREQALVWINEEIAYQQEVGEVPEATSKEPLPRIKTNLSVPELSLLIRALFEVEAFVNQKEKAHVYRHFSRIFDSVEKEDISYNTLRNSQYRPDPHTVVSLKEKVIAMMNFLNSL